MLIITIIGLAMVVLGFLGIVPLWSVFIFIMMDIFVIYKHACYGGVNESDETENSGAIIRYGKDVNYSRVK